MPVFLEANARVPRTRGENQIHVRVVVGWCQADYPLVELPGAEPTAIDTRIAHPNFREPLERQAPKSAICDGQRSVTVTSTCAQALLP